MIKKIRTGKTSLPRIENSTVGRYCIGFESYGVKIGVRSGDKTLLQRIENEIGDTLPGVVEPVDSSLVEHFLDVESKENGGYAIKKGVETVANAADAETFYNFINSQIRLTVAEFAPGKVFLHAGAVGWRGRAIIIPASSFAGKSSLVAALIKRGAIYYSDEYAVLDENGSLHAFPKTLSLRGIVDDFTQVERSAESLGAIIGETPLPIGLVLICRYDKRLKNQRKIAPKILSAGQGMMEMLAHTIPVRNNPKFALEILNKISTRAIIAKCKRGEAEKFADLLLDFFKLHFDI